MVFSHEVVAGEINQTYTVMSHCPCFVEEIIQSMVASLQWWNESKIG